jgi:hypothetical protein
MKTNKKKIRMSVGILCHKYQQKPVGSRGPQPAFECPLVMKISRKNLNRKIFLEIFPFFIRSVDMVSLFTFYTVIIMLIYTSPFILIGR